MGADRISSYQIRVDQLSLHAYHGVFLEEKKLGQHFSIDLVLDLKFSPCLIEDKLDGAISYADVIDLTKKEFCNSTYSTIEKAAYEILQAFSKIPSLLKAEVTINKPSAPVAEKTKNISVKLTREY